MGRMGISFNLTDDEAERLDVLVARTGRSGEWHLRAAVQQYLEDQEDAHTAEVAYRRFQESGRPARPLSELADELFGDE